MTTKVNITLDQNPHDWKVEIRHVDNGIASEQPTATLTKAGEVFESTIWEGRSLIVTEVRRTAEDDANQAAQGDAQEASEGVGGTPLAPSL